MVIMKKELLSRVEYYREHDKYGKVFIPNNIFRMLSTDEELKNKNSKNTAEAYCYLYLNAWLYRNAKYGCMRDDMTEVGALKEIIGLSAKNKGFNYVIKKGGVLDRLGLTRTLNFKEAPLEYSWENEVLEFFNQEEQDSFKHPQQVEDEKLYRKSTRNKTFKYPIFALENEDGEYGEGTFFGNINNTHFVDFEIFVECMINHKLGCTAFYIYSFLSHKCDVAAGRIEISVDTITKQTGINKTIRDIALHGLKAFRLLTCFPAPFIVGADKGEGANVYMVNGIENITNEEHDYMKRKLVACEKKEVI
jgi:hypothetical protein